MNRVVAVFALILAISAGAAFAAYQRRAFDKELARHQARIAEYERQEQELLTETIPALTTRERQLEQRLAAAETRGAVLARQLSEASHAAQSAADRAAALKSAPLSELLREGERLGIKARAR